LITAKNRFYEFLSNFINEIVIAEMVFEIIKIEIIEKKCTNNLGKN